MGFISCIFYCVLLPIFQGPARPPAHGEYVVPLTHPCNSLCFYGIHDAFVDIGQCR